MGKILPVLLALVGLGAGVGAGIALRPAPEPAENTSSEAEAAMENPAPAEGEAPVSEGQDPAENANSEFVKMNNQFVIPIVAKEKVSALVVMSLSLELETGGTEIFFQREPKLRDAFLQVLFDHANSGGFDGVFTQGQKLENLRRALLEMARKIMGPSVKDVLVTDLLRQDV